MGKWFSCLPCTSKQTEEEKNELSEINLTDANGISVLRGTETYTERRESTSSISISPVVANDIALNCENNMPGSSNLNRTNANIPEDTVLQVTFQGLLSEGEYSTNL
ncbi:MAG: hypothetical protein AB8U25_07190 [Rickettsiales endosymbiont of Dermacentor nuttalli]